MTAQHLSLDERSAYQRLEDVVGCKWSAAVVGALQRGVTRPGKLERYIPGISTKVLTERLRKLLDYGLITREEQAGRVQHVDYNLTPTGRKLAHIIEQLHALQAEHVPPAAAAQLPQEEEAVSAPKKPGRRTRSGRARR